MVMNPEFSTSLQQDSCCGDVYLNNAGQARLSHAVQQAGIDAIQTSPMHQSTPHENVRELFAALIETSADNICIHPSTAFSISLVAKNVARLYGSDEKRNKILLMQDQFDSAVYAWQDACHHENSKVLQLEIVKKTDNWTESIIASLNESILVACLSPLHWADGSLVDLVRIGESCRRHGILLVVDATQATGAMPTSVQEIKPAFLVASVHKWLRSPSGMALAYIDPSFHDVWEPLDQHGRGRTFALDPYWDAGSTMGPNGYDETYFASARKFDSGGKPNSILLPMVATALQEVTATVVHNNLQSYLRSLMAPLLKWARDNRYQMPSHHGYHLVGIRPPHLTVSQMITIVKRLQEERIYIAVRCGYFRISPYVDNTPNDINRLIKALDRLCPVKRE